jgi:hypothetical protein
MRTLMELLDLLQSPAMIVTVASGFVASTHRWRRAVGWWPSSRATRCGSHGAGTRRPGAGGAAVRARRPEHAWRAHGRAAAARRRRSTGFAGHRACRRRARRALGTPMWKPIKGHAMTMDQTSARAGTGSTISKGATDAITLLSNDHAEVAELFGEYEALVEGGGDESEKQALAERICALLTTHATIEEEIFYPAAREALEEQQLLDEAEVEHATAKNLIEQIQLMDPTDELYDAKVTVLGEYVHHHVQEEEGELFPRCQGSDLDLEELGEELSARREELIEELGLDEEE